MQEFNSNKARVEPPVDLIAEVQALLHEMEKESPTPCRKPGETGGQRKWHPLDLPEKSELRKRVTVAEAEAAAAARPKLRGPAEPFGYIRGEWLAMTGAMEAGDELWEFSSPEESWVKLCGRQGYAVTRTGEIIDFIVTIMN